jgi:hypothetical protein
LLSLTQQASLSVKSGTLMLLRTGSSVLMTDVQYAENYAIIFAKMGEA